MSKLLAEHPQLDLVLIGHRHDDPLEAYTALLAEYAPRIWDLGFQSKLVATYGVLDAVLNPFRDGGGQSVFLAMRAGLPVLSLAQGDASEHLGQHVVASPEAYFRTAESWLREPTTRRRAAAAQRGAVEAVPTVMESYDALAEVMENARRSFGGRHQGLEPIP